MVLMGDEDEDDENDDEDENGDDKGSGEGEKDDDDDMARMVHDTAARRPGETYDIIIIHPSIHPFLHLSPPRLRAVIIVGRDGPGPRKLSPSPFIL
jgi:hypothetical protein